MNIDRTIFRVRLGVVVIALILATTLTTTTTAMSVASPSINGNQAPHWPDPTACDDWHTDSTELRGNQGNCMEYGGYFESHSTGHARGDWNFATVSTDPNAIALGAWCRGNNPQCIGLFARSKGIAIRAESSAPVAVEVENTNTSTGGGIGVHAKGNFRGVAGESRNGEGVNGFSINGEGGLFTSENFIGVAGQSTEWAGVRGLSVTGPGGSFESINGEGVFGQSTQGPALKGSSQNGDGGQFESQTSDGLRAFTHNSQAFAIETGGPNPSMGNVKIRGDGFITGAWHTIRTTDQGDRLTYNQESTQSMISDQGTAQLVNGRAVIQIEPLYAQMVNLAADYQVLVTPGSLDTAGLGVINKTSKSFEVDELNNGKGSFSFDWWIVAPQRGYENVRLEPANLPSSPQK